MTEDTEYKGLDTLIGIAILGGILFLLAYASKQQKTLQIVQQKQDIMQGWRPSKIPSADDLVIPPLVVQPPSIPIQQPIRQQTQSVVQQQTQSAVQQQPVVRYKPKVPYETLSIAREIAQPTQQQQDITKELKDLRQQVYEMKQLAPIHTTAGTAYKNKEKWKIIRDKSGDIEGIEVIRDANIDSK